VFVCLVKVHGLLSLALCCSKGPVAFISRACMDPNRAYNGRQGQVAADPLLQPAALLLLTAAPWPHLQHQLGSNVI
jgi:hypothetical protein